MQIKQYHKVFLDWFLRSEIQGHRQMLMVWLEGSSEQVRDGVPARGGSIIPCLCPVISVSEPFIVTNALSAPICAERFSSRVMLNQAPEPTAPAVSQCAHTCAVTRKCFLTVLRALFFLHHVWWKAFGRLAVVPRTLQFVAGIRNPGMKWQDGI